MNINAKKILLLAGVSLLCSISSWAQNKDQVFQYPEPPASLENLTDRSSYIIEHFWDRCNLKSIFSSHKNFETAFDHYISVLPYADTTVVFKSIDKLIKEVKKNPNNLLTMSKMAREKLYGDTAEYILDAVYLPFASSAASTNGISKEERERFAREASQLSHSQIGQNAPSFSMTTREGQNLNSDDLKDSYLLIFFDDPDSFENMMARTRLSTDYGLNELISQKQIQVLSLYPGQADEQWKSRVASYPDNWIVAASPQVDMLFDRRWKPTCYYLNKNHIILSKSLSAEELIEGFRVASNRRQQNAAERERLRREAENKRNTSEQ